MKELPNKTYFLAGCVGLGLLLLSWATHREVLRMSFGPKSDPQLGLLSVSNSTGGNHRSQSGRDERFPVLDRLWMLSPVELLLVSEKESVEKASHDLPVLYSRSLSRQNPSRAFLTVDEIDLARRWAVLLAAGHTDALVAVLDAGPARGLPSGLKAESCRWIEIEALYRRLQMSDLRSHSGLVNQLRRCPQADLHRLWIEASTSDLSDPSARLSLQKIIERLQSWSMDPKQSVASRNLAHLMRKSLELRLQ